MSAQWRASNYRSLTKFRMALLHRSRISDIRKYANLSKMNDAGSQNGAQTSVMRINARREGLSVISTVTNKGEMRMRIY